MGVPRDDCLRWKWGTGFNLQVCGASSGQVEGQVLEVAMGTVLDLQVCGVVSVRVEVRVLEVAMGACLNLRMCGFALAAGSMCRRWLLQGRTESHAGRCCLNIVPVCCHPSARQGPP